MLRELRVGNFALVDDLVLALEPGLTMLTGETGAGKSLIAGALSLLTGGKTDRQVIRQGEDLAFVEGVFDLEANESMCDLAAAMGIRLGSDCILVLRRELKREGRGRVLINGLVSSLALLEQIGGELLAIQSQDQQRLLGLASFPGDFLDTVLDNDSLRENVAGALVHYRQVGEQYEARRREEQFAREQLDIWRYQQKELLEAGLAAGEEEELAEKIDLGRNSRALLEAAGSARQGLVEGQVNARQLLGSAESVLAPLSGSSQRLQSILEMIREADAAVGEAAQDLERFLDGVDIDPTRLDELEGRKSLYEELRRKYDRTVEGLMELRDAMTERIARQEEAASDLDQLKSTWHEARRELVAAAEALRENRQQGADLVAARAVETIRPLALPELELEFQVEPDLDEESAVQLDGKPCRITAKGADKVRLLARTNRGEGLGEVGRIASGGEKSRIFLGLSVLQRRGARQSLQLFDEIDAGLGMDNAVPVAELLGRLADGSQVICITHLPTVAARGDHHLKVEKTMADGRTVLRVVPIPGEARVKEIARLLGGDKSVTKGKLDEQAAYARHLLGQG